MSKVESVTVNFNVRTTVELTGAGKRMRAASYSGLGIDEPIADTITEPLWSLFSVFGPHVFMGMPEMPFKHNALKLLFDGTTSEPPELASMRETNAELVAVCREALEHIEHYLEDGAAMIFRPNGLVENLRAVLARVDARAGAGGEPTP